MDQIFTTFSEIFEYGLGYTLDGAIYTKKKIQLIENSPEDILEAVKETEERLSGNWNESIDDEKLQNIFWNNFPKNSLSIYNGAPLHGEILSKFSTTFLRKHTSWLN